MDNELELKKNWFTQNWFWILISSIIFILIICGSISFVNGNITYLSLVNSDPSIYESALEKVNKNSKVIQTYGKLKVSDSKISHNGTAFYSNQKDQIDATLEVLGDKKNAKMLVTVEKSGSTWDYKNIIIQAIENTNDTIVVKK